MRGGRDTDFPDFHRPADPGCPICLLALLCFALLCYAMLKGILACHCPGFADECDPDGAFGEKRR